MFISLIIPVYNRPQETRELLESLVGQTCRDFEVVIVDDGSTEELSSRGVAAEFSGQLAVRYVYQENRGPAAARNTGAANAKGDFFIIMDSDCLVPSRYFETVYEEVERNRIEFFGGPDGAAADFSPLQKAVSYSMTSLFTTGGIRGNKKSIGKFSPRSFNLGISRRLFEKVGGFNDMRIGEDIDFSTRVAATGVKVWFLPDAAVCHKRRTSLKLFFKQVFVFGTARINLTMRHPESGKAVFLLPALFTVISLALFITAVFVRPWFLLLAGSIMALWVLGPIGKIIKGILFVLGLLYAPWWLSVPYGALMLLWFVDSYMKSKSVKIAWLSIWTSFIQLYGYGLGFLYGFFVRRILGKDEQYTYRVTKFFSAKTR